MRCIGEIAMKFSIMRIMGWSIGGLLLLGCLFLYLSDLAWGRIIGIFLTH